LKVLFIGGTGNISTPVSRLCVERGMDLYLLNRGKRKVEIPGVKTLKGGISNKTEMIEILKNHKWDVVVNWIAFNVEDVERDFELFKNKTQQYIFISSASAYQKPPLHPVITESTPLANPYWQYSRDKIECEEKLNKLYRTFGFPITIVRPSYTYDTVFPVAIGGFNEYTIVDRIKKGKKIIIHGDGTSLWTNTHADDFAKAFVGLIGHQQAIGDSFHITSDELLTWNQIYEALADAVGVEAKIIHIPSDFIAEFDDELKGALLGDKSYSVIFDNSKIKRFVPGFTCTIPFKEGIKKTLAWFEEDKQRQFVNKATDDLMDKIINSYEKSYK